MIDSIPLTLIEDKSADVPQNCIGFSIQPASGSDDGFTYGLDDDPSIYMGIGEGGQNFGFQDFEYGYHRQSKINVKFDGVGTSKGCLIIFTVHRPDTKDC